MDNLETFLALGCLVGLVLFSILLIVFQEKRIFARICALLVFICGLWFIGIAGGSLSVMNFIDIPSALGLFLVVLPALIMSGHGKDFSKGIKIIAKNKDASLNELKQASSAFSLMNKATFAAAFISISISVIAILRNLEDASALGPNLATAIISIFYAAIVYLIFATLKANIDRRIINLTDK